MTWTGEGTALSREAFGKHKIIFSTEKSVYSEGCYFFMLLTHTAECRERRDLGAYLKLPSEYMDCLAPWEPLN